MTEDNCTVEQELVKRRSTLLLKYIRRDVQFELEALYAVQLIALKHGHPYGSYCSQHIQLQHRLSVALKTLLHLCLSDNESGCHCSVSFSSAIIFGVGR